MMLAVYALLAWSLAGFLGAAMMGRMIAICSGERDDSAITLGATSSDHTQAAKDARAMKAA